MKKFQLLPNEAKLIQRLQKGDSVHEASKHIGITREAAYHLLKRLVRMSVVRRSGDKGNYRYEVEDIPFDIVGRRGRAQDDLDVKLDESMIRLMNTRLTQHQMLFYQQHKGMDRKQLARHLGMTKAQLNFAIINAGLGSDKVCVRQK